MKKILGLVTAMSLISSTVPMVVACNTQQAEDSFYKKSLKVSIDRAEEVVNTSIEKDSTRIEPLKSSLEWAKRKYNDLRARDDEYLERKSELDAEVNEFEYPGHKAVWKALKELIEETEITIERDPQIKFPKIIDGLKNALIEAKIVLVEEADPLIIKLTNKKLEYWRKAYVLNRTDDLN